MFVYFVCLSFNHSCMRRRTINMVSWCSWLSRQSNTLKVSGSSPGDATAKHFRQNWAVDYFFLLSFVNYLIFGVLDFKLCQRAHYIAFLMWTESYSIHFLGSGLVMQIAQPNTLDPRQKQNHRELFQ